MKVLGLNANYGKANTQTLSVKHSCSRAQKHESTLFHPAGRAT